MGMVLKLSSKTWGLLIIFCVSRLLISSWLEFGRGQKMVGVEAFNCLAQPSLG